ncbi:predicted protein [Scheffersomyces stipitis CBS 6054]|uniref:Uncharacterized protein n=1 Tax=Scheffersomyces stipitis (strain ATCC 58785 / CBS 6054 / NBRC 10063 / NRRL Y-11545) TaxID=322104 RepID=A3LNP6_PICST|nr:predicted protein [Scheffersomyces stipitis CBS 6054]ABN64363.2 predicted protein [Scheffersomyces stipitis CBS 6054]
MTTLVSPAHTQFSRRVSFNNLHHDDCDGLQNALAKPTSPKNSLSAAAGPIDVTFGYGSAVLNDIQKAYNNSTYMPVKKKLRLPDPPSKSILKNKVSPQQLEFNEKNGINFDDFSDKTINYHEDLDSAVDDSEEPVSSGNSLVVPGAGANKGRRKSYSEMTNEELMALDPQFQTTRSKTQNVDKFKFDSQKMYYLPSTRRSSTAAAAAAAAAAKLVEYPTSNENNYNSISLTVKHDQFDTILVNRTLLSVISGRRHTWNALDWLFLIDQDGHKLAHPDPSSSFLTDGDYLIIASIIPVKFIKELAKKNRKQTLDEYLYNKCEKLLNYIMSTPMLRESNLKLKITVEFIPDIEVDSSVFKPCVGSKYMLQHLFKQYQPNLMIIGNKSSNLNFKYPIKIKRQNERDEYLIKLSSYIVKYSTVPVILVGSSTKFHNDYYSAHSSDASSIESVESFNGDQLDAQRDFEEKLKHIEEIPNNYEDKFRDIIALISDNALNEATSYLSAISSKDDSVKINSKVHAIYRSQTTSTNSNDRIYKVKSMISYNEEDEAKNDKLIKQLKQKRRSSASKSVSGVSSSSDSSLTAPKETEAPGKKKSIWKKFGFKK